jgi:hypothetical protein
MTTVHILTLPGREKHAEITKIDIKFIDTQIKISMVNIPEDAWEQLKILASLELQPGDIVCRAGLCIRQTVINISKIAAEHKINYMPGIGVDHRGVAIEPGKILDRLPLEKNGLNVWPYLMVVGDPESAKLSFEVAGLLDKNDYWKEYEPETPRLEHVLGIAFATGYWQAPDWFKVVDMSVRNLEIAPIMYAHHMWHDWIAFYPANGNFKLENHTQLLPIWLAESEKPLEYWRRG